MRSCPRKTVTKCRAPQLNMFSTCGRSGCWKHAIVSTVCWRSTCLVNAAARASSREARPELVGVKLSSTGSKEGGSRPNFSSM